MRAGEAIIKAVKSDTRPSIWLLGRRALDSARSKIELLRRDVDAWEETALSADYPEHQTTVAK